MFCFVLNLKIVSSSDTIGCPFRGSSFISLPWLSPLELFLQQDNKENWAKNNFVHERSSCQEEKELFVYCIIRGK